MFSTLKNKKHCFQNLRHKRFCWCFSKRKNKIKTVFLVSILNSKNTFGNIYRKIYYKNKNGENTYDRLTEKYQKLYNFFIIINTNGAYHSTQDLKLYFLSFNSMELAETYDISEIRLSVVLVPRKLRSTWDLFSSSFTKSGPCLVVRLDPSAELESRQAEDLSFNFSLLECYQLFF